MRLRLIDEVASGGGGGPGLPGALNMGIDESIIQGLGAGTSEPTLRLYRWSPACITLGYFQDARAEVDLEACAAAGVDVVRRVTAGGAVFHEAELTYSIVLPLGTELSPLDILESYTRICAGLVRGLGELGVEARFAPVNDIEVGGKKVSGNAQTRKRGCLLQHGTILLGLDPERMFSLLRVPEEKLRRKLVASAKDRVTCLSTLLGREVGYEEAARALKSGLAAAWSSLGVELVPGCLGPGEYQEAQRLSRERYATPAWTLEKTFEPSAQD